MNNHMRAFKDKSIKRFSVLLSEMSSRCENKGQLRAIHRLIDSFLTFLNRLECADAVFSNNDRYHHHPNTARSSGLSPGYIFGDSFYLDGKARHGSCNCCKPGERKVDPKMLYDFPLSLTNYPSLNNDGDAAMLALRSAPSTISNTKDEDGDSDKPTDSDAFP